MSPKDAGHWVLAQVPVIATLLAGGIAWGTTVQRVAALEEQTNDMISNRERLVRIEATAGHMSEDIAEIRRLKTETQAEVRELQKHVIELDAKLEALLHKLRKSVPDDS